MSATSLEQVMQKYDCTTIEELKKKHHELDQRAEEMAKQFVYAHGIKDRQLARELVPQMNDNWIKLSEIEKALRSL